MWRRTITSSWKIIPRAFNEACSCHCGEALEVRKGEAEWSVNQSMSEQLMLATVYCWDAGVMSFEVEIRGGDRAV